MRKLACQLGHDDRQEPRPSKTPLILLVGFLVIGLGPLALEAGAICLGNWKEFMGIPADVRTPVVDSLRENLDAMRDTLWFEVTPFFRHVPWEPRAVLPAAALVMAVAMLMLHRRTDLGP